MVMQNACWACSRGASSILLLLATAQNVSSTSTTVAYQARRFLSRSARWKDAGPFSQPTHRQLPSVPHPDHSSATKDKKGKLEHRTQYNYDPFTLTPSEQHYHFPLVTAKDLENSSIRPRNVRMLASDFIHDSLYNKHYGYFSRQAVLLPHLQESMENKVQDEPHFLTAFGPVDATGSFDFRQIKNEAHFMRAVQLRYDSFERDVEAREAEKITASTIEQQEAKKRSVRKSSADGLEEAQRWGRLMKERDQQDNVQEPDVMAMAARQVWHTPTELFKPHYAEAVARYLISEYKLNLFPYDDLVIYEVGAGSGTLAEGILNYIRDHEPEVYQRTSYRIVEISARLAQQQTHRLQSHKQAGKVQLYQQSMLDWNKPVTDPCFIVALEVLDNLTHDVVRYHTGTLEPYQALVSIDETGDMHELWEPVRDEGIKQYLSLLRPNGDGRSHDEQANAAIPSALRYIPRPIRKVLSDHFPIYPNLTRPHYLPTASLRLLHILRDYFPLHRLVLSDFSSLPDASEGVNAPVVQTRYKGTMVPVTTYRVLQGFFDIFFPTNFEELRRIYGKVMSSQSQQLVKGSSSSGAAIRIPPRPSPMATTSALRPDYFTRSRAPALGSASDVPDSILQRRETAQILSHAEFLSHYARNDLVRLKDGSNPMLTWYANASWLLT
ncbi:DUF185-domain-containing protein [Tilletiaria anomala UBC 951]|uniref:type II protein arginine methyltransferase n=1 Tax=Tilletiaria anomala (strain ATCC 24038 / CBS 436.72 / UBC 951) TaxID=1037660 RepID=A0A066WM81_TILAU|nr:DUF185-domain-containing protein [Tilletiaria anomala UBC 951]KDN52109.1 DUF185-domain-containing protein [Tilletiaria anomala UBC 951]